MAKQGNNGNRRKGTSKRTQAPARSSKRQPAAAPQSPETALEPPATPPATESTEPAQSARRQRRRATQPTSPTVPPAEQGPVPRGRRPRRPVEADAGSTPPPHAASEPEPALQPPAVFGAEPAAHDTPILPVEVIDAATVPDEVLLEEPGGDLGDLKATGRRARERTGPRSNALGTLIELRFADSMSPVRSYSELERRSGISREALSRYVTPRADRRRSPTIDTLAAIADAMHLSLEQVCRAAVAGAHGQVLPEQTVSQERDEMIRPFISTLGEEQFLAVIELLRQMQAHSAQS